MEAIQHVFNSVSPEKAKAVLLALCEIDPLICSCALVMLDRPTGIKKTLPTDIESPPESPPSTPHQQGTKRKAESDLLICGKCQNPYSEEDNHDKACWTHPA